METVPSSPGSTLSRRPSLLSKTFRNSFRLVKGALVREVSDGSADSRTASPDLKDRQMNKLEAMSPPTSHPNVMPFSPLMLETKEIKIESVAAMQPLSTPLIGGNGSAHPNASAGPDSVIREFLGRMRSDSQKKRDSAGSNNSAPKGRTRSASRMSRLRRVVQVDEAEKVNLLSRLRATLLAIEHSLVVTEKELESHLEEHDFVLDKAASDFLERTGLRQIEPNRTLKKIDFMDDNPSVHDAWSPCNPSVFTVRCGPQYRKSKIKAPANPQPIYDMIAVDLFASDEKVEHMSRFMKIGDMEKDEGSHPLPSVFIVNFMLPLCEPRMFNNEANGPTVAFQFIMKLSDWAKQNPDHPSVQLAAKFVNESGPNGSMRERLKIIVQVANPDEMDLGKVERGLCRQYNGLPFLYRTYNSKYHRGSGWFQADFDGHKSGYATRLARYSLLGWCDKIVANVAVLVEAETDEEMPERILGCANVHRLHCRDAPRFVKPAATPLSPNSARRGRDHGSSLLSETDGEGSEAEIRARSHGDSLLSEPEENFRDAVSGE